jgi:hypothetical protein
MRLAFLTCGLLALTACPPPKYTPPPAQPTAKDVVDRLAKARAELHSFTGESVMDYWLGNQRVKGSVLVMGEQGSKVRFAALSPAGESTMAEMACDGTNFVYVDHQNNCALTGPCNKYSIAQFFKIELDPDDFLHLALGTPPVVADPSGTVTWDGAKGYERVKLSGAAGGAQTLAIDARDQRWDVVDSELVGTDGKTVWSVANTDFQGVKDPAGAEHRLPGKTHFKSPDQKSDLLVEWGTRTVNVDIAPAKFTIPVPAGLPVCGATAPKP